METREEGVRKLLIENRDITDGYHWPWLGGPGRLSMRHANKFLLGACIDYQIRADKAWENAGILAETILGDPDDLWAAIRKVGFQKLRNVFGGEHKANGCRRCAEGHQLVRSKDSDIPRHTSLHRFKNQAAKRVWNVTQIVLKCYGGDARKIWNDRPADAVHDRLVGVGLGTNLSHMVVGALLDTKQIKGRGKLKADLNVCRVLGRVFFGEQVTPEEAHRIAGTIESDNAWSIDGQLYALGQENCSVTNPNCLGCFLQTKCEYYDRHPY